MAKWLVRAADGMILSGGPFEPTIPSLGAGTSDDPYRPDPVYTVLILPDDVEVSRRLDRYDGNGGVRPATADEIAAYDAAQPKLLNTRDLIRRMTSAEVFFLQSAASQNADACHFWTKLLTNNMTDVHSPEWEQGVAFFVPAGVQAGVWPDTATANARVAEITA